MASFDLGFVVRRLGPETRTRVLVVPDELRETTCKRDPTRDGRQVVIDHIIMIP